MDFYTFFLAVISILVIGFLLFSWIVASQPKDELVKKTDKLVDKTSKKKGK